MEKRVVAAISVDIYRSQLSKAAKKMDLIEIDFIDGKLLKDEREWENVVNGIKENAQGVLVSNITQNEDINSFLLFLKNELKDTPIIPIGAEILETNFFNIEPDKALYINRYFTYGGFKNILNSLYYIGYNFLNFDNDKRKKLKEEISEPEFVPFDGIFHPETDRVFDSFDSYFNWYIKDGTALDYRWVAVLTHRHHWNSNNIEVESALIREFEYLGLKVIPVFSYASAENIQEIKDFGSIIRDYFSFNNEIIIDGLVNLQMLAAVSNSEGGNIFEQGIKVFKEMDIPVFRPLISHMLDEKTWSENIGGLIMEIPWAFTTPEMLGMIEPVIIGCRGETGKYVPINERVNKFAKRVAKWIELGKIPNHAKKVAFIIHSAPCSGVEATIGFGVGLDVFESLVRILKELKNKGYKVENIPENGEELHEMIMNRKAYQDFRWTSVEDIIESGGVLYEMPLTGDYGYIQFYNTFDKEVCKALEEAWGKPPGEAMVYNGKLIITGVEFGNITVMLQPKRGCYGAKCTGEVCKILHDPQCPPPHQYIATYRYIEEIMKANAVIHVGTGGSLEYLPGKTNAMSNKCYGDIVIGTIPNIYIYNAGVGTEGTLAKRRNYAVILDYLPACMASDLENCKLVNIIGEYIEAVESKSKQAEIKKRHLDKRIADIKGAKEIVDSEKSFIDGIKKLKNYLVQSIKCSKNQKLHILGEIPAFEEIVSYIREYLNSNSKSAAAIKKACKDEYNYNIIITEMIKEIINESESKTVYEGIDNQIFEELKSEVDEIYEKLLSVKFEMENLINVLEGRFVEPGLSGMPSENFKNILPTGRNFYLMDCQKIPTKEAYEIGRILAEKLIEKYIEEEGKYPEKVAMNMISTDISMTKGEQLSQILSLMGITPVWNENGIVVDLKAIPSEKLKRPRIDVTVRISGVLRDSYPDAVNLIDKAAVLASSLDEATEYNYVKKNTLEIAKVLKELGQDEDIKRRSTIRVFGDKPGTYGAGVDLALKASAWKNEDDIAKIFVYFSSYAYGDKLNGCMAKHEFVENVKSSDISYEVTISDRYDILSSSFAATIQGGFGALNRVLSGKKLKQYHGSSEKKDNLRVFSAKEEIKKVMNETLFNPLWKESIKQRGYTGASELMRKIQTIFDWQCLSHSIEDKDIDNLVRLYVNDEKMREWFNKNNKYAIEEISRRFLELHERKKWMPDKEVLGQLKRNYVKIEGDMEELLENSKGEFQGGRIEVQNYNDVKAWRDNLKEIEDVFKLKGMESVKNE